MKQSTSKLDNALSQKPRHISRTAEVEAPAEGHCAVFEEGKNWGPVKLARAVGKSCEVARVLEVLGEHYVTRVKEPEDRKPV